MVNSFSLGNWLGVLCQGLRRLRAVIILGADFLSFFGVEEFQVGFGDFGGAVLGCHLIDDAHRRLGQDADGGRDHFDFVFTKFVEREVGFVFPGEQHVADAALRRKWWWSRARRNQAREHSCKRV